MQSGFGIFWANPESPDFFRLSGFFRISREKSEKLLKKKKKKIFCYFFGYFFSFFFSKIFLCFDSDQRVQNIYFWQFKIFFSRFLRRIISKFQTSQLRHLILWWFHQRYENSKLVFRLLVIFLTSKGT